MDIFTESAICTNLHGPEMLNDVFCFFVCLLKTLIIFLKV